MNVLKKIILLTVFALSTSVYASTGATVVNRDSVDHVLIVEDENENIVEHTIAPGQTLPELCKNECYLYLKSAENFEYIDGTTVTYFIQNGRLVIEEDQT